MYLKFFSPFVTAYAAPPLTALSPLSYSRHLPALRGVTSSEGGKGLYRTSVHFYLYTREPLELFYLIAADGAYIKNAAAVLTENRLDHFFIIR